MRFNVFQKYRLMNTAQKSNIINPRTIANCNKTIQPRGRYISLQVKRDIQDFFERDDVSRMTAGKKEYISFKKEKEQKRYLLETRQNLHKKFISLVPYSISYQSFCRFKPFWVLTPKVEDRETCRCTKHLNFELILATLSKENIFDTRSTEDLIHALCCFPLKPECLYRTCNDCCNKYIKANEFVNKSISYWKWTSISEEDPKSKKMLRKTIKSEQPTTRLDLFNEFQNSMQYFFNHCGDIFFQYKAISSLKSSLKSGEILIHVDFSENYACKYGEEIQSFHFGGSRKQITLHTGVFYMRNNEGEIISHSFCTMSTSLRHDYVAIWAHLKIVFPWIKELVNEKLTVVHFLSDGPATQYKNRLMFHVISNYITHFLPDVTIFTWNYSIAGHGKGAADGIGGTLKRTADLAVAQGKDIANINQLINILKERCPAIYMKELSNEEIMQVDTLFSKISAPAFSGTMSVHQVIFFKEVNCLYFNRLSCFSCVRGTAQCSHFFIGKAYQRQIKNGKTLQNATSSIESKRQLMDEWVAVAYNNQWIPGIAEKRKSGKILVNFMKVVGPNRFIWPDKKDTDIISADSIISKMHEFPELLSYTGRSIHSLSPEEFQRITDLFMNIL